MAWGLHLREPRTDTPLTWLTWPFTGLSRSSVRRLFVKLTRLGHLAARISPGVASEAGVAGLTHEGRLFYSEKDLLLHKKMWDLITRDKEGVPKQHSFSEWCQRTALHRGSTAASSGSTGSTAASSAAAEHAESNTSFRRLAEDILTHELSPAQMDDPVYSLRGDKTITTKQRSFINSLLRKNLGDARVAYYIFEHGVPTLLDAPLQRKPAQRAMLQNMLEEFMTWHASFLQCLHDREQHPNTITARRLSDLDQKQWQTERRRKKRETERRLSQGAHLATLRDSKKRKCDDMTATEQQVLEDFETQIIQKHFEKLRVHKP